MTDPLDARLHAIVGPDAVRRNAPLAELTTLRVGGPADWLVEVRRVDDLLAIVHATHDARVRLAILGGGSNVIVADDGVRGVVVRLRMSDISQPTPDAVRAEAGV